MNPLHLTEMSPAIFLTRLGIAVLLGAFIGVERQYTHHAAGLKTNALVSTGSALFMMLAMGPGMTVDTYSRVAAQIISGIGFLGGGVILRDGFHVRGLTTAATLWCAAAVGTLTGSGHLWGAAAGCSAVLAVNVCLKHLSVKIGEEGLTGSVSSSHYRLQATCLHAEAPKLRAELMQIASTEKFLLESVKTDLISDKETELSVQMQSLPDAKVDFAALVAKLGVREGVRTVSWERSP